MNKQNLKDALAHHPMMARLAYRLYYLALAVFAKLLRFRYLGRCYIPRDVTLLGVRDISTGTNCGIGSGSWLNVNHRGRGMGITIGNNCIIGRDNFFSSGNSIRVGDYCLTTRYCAFIGSSHVYKSPLQPYASTGTSNSNSIYIGANCFFGYGARVIGNVHIGHGSVIGAGAVVTNDIPPFSLVVGNPAAVIKRYNFDSESWTRDLTLSIGEFENEDVYLMHLKKQHLVQPIPALNSRIYDLP